MEYAKPDKLLAALRENDAAAANERHQLVRPLHPLDLCLVDQHPVSKKLSRVICDHPQLFDLAEHYTDNV